MKRILIKFLCIVALFFPVLCLAQDYKTMMHFEDILEYAEEKKNYEKLLVNGHAYEDRYKRAKGHPFFLHNDYVLGDVFYAGLKFENQRIKFNTYDQKLVLKLEMEKFGWEIELPIEHVDEFTMGNYLFRKFSLPETDPAYYQVVAEAGAITCLYRWTKPREESDHLRGYLSYKFGEDKVKKYLLVGDESVYFKNIRTFAKPFPEDVRAEVIAYLKKYNIRLKSISDRDMKELILFCQVCLEKSQNHP